MPIAIKAMHKLMVMIRPKRNIILIKDRAKLIIMMGTPNSTTTIRPKFNNTIHPDITLLKPRNSNTMPILAVAALPVATMAHQ
jgi:hypothetical protein